ncbi:MAG TPA: selenocysteine-specific translation elongation factor [Silvibacterium sp.]|nr:selenocysteine-specific translation elongation factor [Silvibacterium sp.]
MVEQVRSVVVGTAGHIDHGKTALVRALTGDDTDRLPEEKKRGITIDLGFASLDAVAADDTPVRISFVDVPGHHHFIHNMLAGAGCIDAVLLVISAEEGVKPQTEEHLAICTLLGIRRGLTVISKADAVSDAHLERVRSKVKAFLSGTFLDRGAGILAVSAHTGQGLEELRSRLWSLAMGISGRSPGYVTRLPLDRAFVMKGFGTVVTGTLLSGALRTGQYVALEPGSRVARIREMQTHRRAGERVHSGSRVALNLAGIDVSDVSRGQTIVDPGALTAVTTIDVEASLLTGSKELKHRATVHFHAFTSDTLAAVSLYGHNAAEAGAHRFMRLRLHKPVVLVPGDRFVLRQCSPPVTIGGGRVLDAHPLPGIRKAKCLAWLEAIKEASLEEQIVQRVARRRTAGLFHQMLSGETGLTGEELHRIAEPLIREGRLVFVSGEIWLSSEAIESGAEKIVSRLEIETTANGLKRSELKSQVALSAEIFDFLLAQLLREQRLKQRGEVVFSAGTGEQTTNPDTKLLSAIAATYEGSGLAAPSRVEVASHLKLSDGEMHRLMTQLLREKTLIRMGTDDLYIHRTALEGLRAQIRELHGQILDVARFKQIVGLSRKYAIPLLEYLDRERITRKEGDRRIVL